MSLITWLTVYGLEGYFGSKATYKELIIHKKTAIPWSELIVIHFSLSTCALIRLTLTPLTLLIRAELVLPQTLSDKCSLGCVEQ